MKCIFINFKYVLFNVCSYSVLNTDKIVDRLEVRLSRWEENLLSSMR